MGWNHGSQAGANSGCKCDLCTARRDRDREKFRERNRVYALNYYHRNKEKISQKQKKWRKENIEHHRNRTAEWEAIYEQTTAAAATNHGKPWTDEEKEIALDSAISAEDAAIRLGRTYYSINRIRDKARHDHKERHRKWREDNREHVRAKARENYLKRKAERDMKPKSNHGEPWTDDDRAIALDRSLTAIEAASRLGRTEGSVRNLRNKANRKQQSN